VSATPTIVIERGRTVPFPALPPRSIALDGYVQGPRIEPETERYSFDHHAGCIRHVTLATCEMTLDALRVGLSPAGMTVFLNDLDPDSVVAAWLLLRPEAARDENVAFAVRSLGRFDALGPAVGGPGLVPALRWALAPLLAALEDGSHRMLSDTAYRELFESCVTRLDRWCLANAPSESPSFPPPPRREAPRLDILHDGGSWCLARTEAGLAGFAELYASGWRAAVVFRPLPDGTTEFSVGKASELVSGFDVPRILAALAELELRKNPMQSPAHNWGGGTTIGGSPRNADGSASRLSWPEVAAAVASVVARPRSDR
jgi:hypothetical protein